MEFKGRSLYNCLRSSVSEEDVEVKKKPWRLWDYTQFSLEQLFSMVAKEGILLPKEHFIFYGESCDSPEELLECLWVHDGNVDGQERVYLLFFELWKRLVPEKRCLSIFFDELDTVISLFDLGHLLEEERMRNLLAELEDILQEGAQSNTSSSELFSYSAHDVEEFLYDYIAMLLDEGQENLASLFITAFKKHVPNKLWFSLLQVRLLALSGSKEYHSSLLRVMEEAEEKGDVLFLQEIGLFLAEGQEWDLFFFWAEKVIFSLQTEEDLQDLLSLLAEVCEGGEVWSSAVESRMAIDGESPLQPQDRKLFLERLAHYRNFCGMKSI